MFIFSTFYYTYLLILTTLAGTPTTVAPSGTSSRTTALAPSACNNLLIENARRYFYEGGYLEEPADHKAVFETFFQDRKRKIK